MSTWFPTNPPYKVCQAKFANGRFDLVLRPHSKLCIVSLVKHFRCRLQLFLRAELLNYMYINYCVHVLYNIIIIYLGKRFFSQLMKVLNKLMCVFPYILETLKCK